MQVLSEDSTEQRDSILMQAKWTYFAGNVGEGDDSEHGEDDQWGEQQVFQCENDKSSAHEEKEASRKSCDKVNEEFDDVLLSPSADKMKYRHSDAPLSPSTFLSPVDRARLAMKNKGKYRSIRSGRKSSIMISLSSLGYDTDDTDDLGGSFSNSSNN